MEFIFLGTSAGTPTRRRNVSGLALKIRGSRNWYLVDCGEGSQHRILRTDLSLHKLKAVFITHVHGDHCYGLPGLLASAAMSGRTEPLLIVAPAGVEEMLAVIQRTTELRLPYPVNHVAVENSADPLELADFLVEPIELSHRVRSHGYVFTEKNIEASLDIARLQRDGIQPGPVWGRIQKGEDLTMDNGRRISAADYRITRRKPRIIVICGDNDRPGMLRTLGTRPDVVVHEATYTAEIADRVGSGPGHSSARAVAEYAQNVSLRHLVLTHFSPRYAYGQDASPSIRDIENEARSHFKGSLFLANDFDRFHLDRNGSLIRFYPATDAAGKAPPGTTIS